MNFVAFPLAILVFLLPGFAWLLVSGLLNRLNLLGAIAISFILSLCVVSVTSALLSLLTSKYLLYTIVLTLILPTIIAVVYLREHGFRKLLGQSAEASPLLLLCLVVYILFLLAYFWSTPYYPTTPDPLAHAQVTQSIFGGGGRSVLLHSNVPAGLPFVAAVLMTLLEVNPLQSLTILASLVLLTILVLIFVSAQALLDDRNLAAMITIIGGLALPADAMHFILIGTYPNMVDDAILLTTVFVLFSYLRKPSVPVGMTLALVGLAGVFMHSSFLLFLAALWLSLPVLFVLFRGRRELARYFRACTYSTIGIFVAALVALSFLRGNVERVLESYSIMNFIGGATTSQLLQSLGVVYYTLAWNIVFLIKPVNLVAIILGFVLVATKGRRSIGRIFAASWLGVLLIMSLLSGETDRFVLFFMIPSMFLVGNFVGNIQLPKAIRSAIDRRLLTGGVLLVLIVFGGFLPLIPVAFSPSRRAHEQDIYASMQWLERNGCPSSVQSLGLDSDYRFLPILTNLQYSGSLPPTTGPDQVLQESRDIGFACIVMQTDNPNYAFFAVNQAFQQKYRNTEVAIFFITS